MKVLTQVFKSNIKLVLVFMGSMFAFSSATVAGNLDAGVSDPAIVSPKRFGSDVSAFYLGVTGGFATGGTDRFGLTTPSDTFAIGELDLSGSYGGIRAGWRGVLPAKQGRDYVYGFELGFDLGSLGDDVATQVSGVTVTGGSEISDAFSIRFRNGLTNKSGTVLYFLSVGYVNGDVKTTNSLSVGTTPQFFESNDSRNGFSASIGAEHNLNENWSITGEYEYVQFDAKDVVFENGFSTRSTPRYRGLRFGLNYRF